MEPEDPYQDDAQDGMSPMREVGRINLIILLAYAGLLLVFSFVGAGGDLGVFYVWGGLGMLAQGAINIVLGVVFFIMKKPEHGKGALLSGLVLLVIGFSACVVAISTISFH